MDHREMQWRLLLLFPNRRKHADTAVADLKNRFRHLALFVPDLDAMQSLNVYFFHLVCNRMLAISGKTIHAGAYPEVCRGRLRGCRRAHKCRSHDRRCARNAAPPAKGRWSASGSPASGYSLSFRWAPEWD